MTLRYSGYGNSASTALVSDPFAYQPKVTNQSYFPDPSPVRQPQAEMSATYLQMKQAQETQTMLESSNPNPVALNRLKADQAAEYQHNLQRQQAQVPGPHGLTGQVNPMQYAPISTTQNIKTCTYNAQGEAVSHNNSSLYQDRFNKYKHLKEISPEMLNRMQGRQGDQCTLPAFIESTDDIYTQTSCYRTPQTMGTPCNQLAATLQQRQSEIMSQPLKRGIQCYSGSGGSAGQSGCGTTLDDAFGRPLQ